MSKVTVTFERETCSDDSPDVSYLEQECFNDEEGRARLAAFHAGDWGMIGIRAKATIVVRHSNGNSTSYTLTSAGLWGIESDSPESYLADIYAEQCEELKIDIKAMKQAEFKD